MRKTPANEQDEATLEALSEAIESGAGLPAVARPAGKALGARVALIDRSSAVLAVSTLLALELERARAPEWASDEAAGQFVRAVLERQVTDRGDIVARAAELGAQVEVGGGVVIARAAPRAAQAGEWRARVLVVALRALRAASS